MTVPKHEELALRLRHAYTGGAIPPNSTLVFEVEVMNIAYQPPAQ